MVVRSARRGARREWSRRETPELVHGIRRRFVEALAAATGPAPVRYERAVQSVVQEMKLQVLRHTGDLDLAMHAAKRTRDICLETARGLHPS